MDYISETDSDISEPDIEEYEDRTYEDMKNGKLKVKLSEKVFRCPFCRGKRKQYHGYTDLLQHSSGVGKGSRRSMKEKVKHLALARYLEKDLAPVSPLQPFLESASATEHDSELFVYPWRGVVVNLPTQWKDGRYTGSSGSRLRDQLKKEGLDPLRVHPLWNDKGYSGTALVEFNKDWLGFHNAMSFERYFEAVHCGKKDWLANMCHDCGSNIYGWIARDSDYNAENFIGEILRTSGDLRSIADLVAEEKRKTSALVTNLANIIDEKNKHLEEIECNSQKISFSLINLMSHNDRLHQAYEEEMEKMQQNGTDHFKRIFDEHEKLMSCLYNQWKEFQMLGIDVEKREAQYKQEGRKLFEEKNKSEVKNDSLEMATLAEENRPTLDEDHKKEKENLHERILQLEEELGAKRALELEIEHLKAKLNDMKNRVGGERLESEENVEAIVESLEESREELDEKEIEAMVKCLNLA